MNIVDLIRLADFDFENIVICLDSSDFYSDVKLTNEISPEKYLDFAKIDSKLVDIRGRINAISNAKRAIDCQTEIIIKKLKIDLKNSVVKTFIIKASDIIEGMPVKYNIIKALNIAPVLLIAEIRKLRNKIEHEYKVPTNIDVISAIELAELYINNVNHKLENMYMFEITDKRKIEKVGNDKISGIYFSINQNDALTLRYEREEVLIQNNDLNYYFVIAIMLSVKNDLNHFERFLSMFFNNNGFNLKNELNWEIE